MFVGEDAWEKRGSLTVQRTLEAGTVQSWDDLHHIWLHTYNNELRVDSEYYPLLICEATSIARKDREMNIYKAFESFQVPAYYSSFSSELMMYASGKTTGMAVSLGLLYIAPHSDDEVIKAKEYFQTIEQSYELPDGQIIQTDVKRFAAPEVLFKPHLMGMSDVSLHQAIYTSSLRCDEGIRR